MLHFSEAPECTLRLLVSSDIFSSKMLVISDPNRPWRVEVVPELTQEFKLTLERVRMAPKIIKTWVYLKPS